MAPGDRQRHVIIFPFMGAGHMIPFVDLAMLLSQRGLAVTIATTPLNVARIESTIAHVKASGLKIQTAQLRFPSKDYGLPENCENFEVLTNHEMAVKFLVSLKNLKAPFERLLQESSPDCVVVDGFFYWALKVARERKIPGIVFTITSCFSRVLLVHLHNLRPQERVTSDSEPFLVPGLPDKIELTKAQLPDSLGFRNTSHQSEMMEMLEGMAAADDESDGIVVNSFDELEPTYLQFYRDHVRKPLWTIGPVCLCHSRQRSQRGKESAINEAECLQWLDSRKERSVLYVSFGSIYNLSEAQLLEIEMGLKNSGVFFIWVIKGPADDDKFAHGFRKEVGEAGLIIREQHLNEKLVIQVLGTGVKVGSAVISMALGEENQVEVVKRECIEKAIRRVMGDGQEAAELGERARRLGESARKAMGEGGSSYLNLSRFVETVNGYDR
ncbi:UDP-glycosyltransferase 73C3-like [Nymphaea colorata]|uniref:UDP-glycosyltransferase 73C3-like n=1 Tax=Nymphaea colorata TaxID=210225 RepID=UPI00129D69DE|nr:UDP-glycosyltransferase 73C3-like [Nymphaea colorata]